MNIVLLIAGIVIYTGTGIVFKLHALTGFIYFCMGGFFTIAIMYLKRR